MAASVDVDSRSDDSSSTTSSKPSVASTATTAAAPEVNVAAAAVAEAGNLERFLTSTTPSVTAQYLPKVFSGFLFAASVDCCVVV